MSLPRSTPEFQGISSSAIREYVEAADKNIDTMHSFMLVRHGCLIAAGWWKPEAADKPHLMWSLSKSFTSTAIGLAIEEGKLSLDDHVLKFFPADASPHPSDNLKAMTVRDLLTMTCGHETEPKEMDGHPSVKLFLEHPVPHQPGTHFQYNTMGTYVLSAILTKVTGLTTLDYLKPRLFEPLGIKDPEWASSPEGYSLGGYGLKLCTEDVAKFGQLYLQKGKWKGRKLVPEKWVELATAKHVSNDQESHANIGIDWKQGYGFQFWRCTHNAYRGDGAGGQFCIVIPDKDVVLALTADTKLLDYGLGVAMLLGRFAFLIPVLAIAGSLAAKPKLASSAGTFPTDGPLFIGLLIGVILILGGLQYLPALALGPIAEHVTLLAGKLY